MRMDSADAGYDHDSETKPMPAGIPAARILIERGAVTLISKVFVNKFTIFRGGPRGQKSKPVVTSSALEASR